jgi:tetratricopeptide (TPR) repeat protein
MPGESSYQTGLKLFEEGQYEGAVREFDRALGQEETSERWNDWATVQATLNQAKEAEQGFRRALEIDPTNAQAAANLGGLLFKLERYEEARGFLQMSLATSPSAAHHQAAGPGLAPAQHDVRRSTDQTTDAPARRANEQATVAVRGLDDNQKAIALSLLHEIQSKPQPLKILIVHEVLPHPDQNGCDVRLMRILSELLVQGHKLTFVVRDGADRERYTLPLEQLGIKVFSHDLECLHASDLAVPRPGHWQRCSRKAGLMSPFCFTVSGWSFCARTIP